jgi:hypothetical protein
MTDRNEIVVSHKELEQVIHRVFNVNKNLKGKKKVAK